MLLIGLRKIAQHLSFLKPRLAIGETMSIATAPSSVSLAQITTLLNEDLSREYSHMHFYLHASIVVRGLHREEYSEMFRGEATSEMTHVQQFAKLILGIGGTPNTGVATFRSDITDPIKLVEEAMRMEKEVVANYVDRMDQAIVLQENGGDDRIHGRYIEIFLEDQILHSRSDVDNYREILDQANYKY